MKKLNSIEQFRALQKDCLSQRDPEIPTIVVPAGTCGRASGAETIIRTIEQEITDKGLSEKINLRITGCHGFYKGIYGDDIPV